MLRPRPSPLGTSPPATAPSGSSAATTTAMDNPRTPLLEHKPLNPTSPPIQSTVDSSSSPEPPVSPAKDGEMENLSRKSQWIILAVASGACAAFNGVFAKLTTTELTTSFADSIARLLGLGDGVKVVEFIIRAMFFGLNLIFNGVMWALFTKALARGTSTTQVSIINTSSNFMITAFLGFFIFTESLPPLWWVGGALLIAGNVIIGRREEKDVDHHANAHGLDENGNAAHGEEEDGLLGQSVELADESEVTLKRTPEEDDDILDLGTPVNIVQR